METDYFNIVAVMLQGDSLTLYLFIICQDYVLRMSIDVMEKVWKGKKQKTPQKTITDEDYADDIALLANSLAQSLLLSLEWVAGGIGLHVNADKIEYMCFNQRSNISILKGGLLKVLDKFTYHGSSVSSTENDINMRLAKHGQLSIGYWSY